MRWCLIYHYKIKMAPSSEPNNLERLVFIVHNYHIPDVATVILHNVIVHSKSDAYSLEFYEAIKIMCQLFLVFEHLSGRYQLDPPLPTPVQLSLAQTEDHSSFFIQSKQNKTSFINSPLRRSQTLLLRT